MVSREHPCKPDCPARSATCRTTCQAWREYEQKRNADYAKRDPEADYTQYCIGIMERARRKAERHRRK